MANQPALLFPSDRRSLLQIVRSFVSLLDERVAGRGDDGNSASELPGGISFDAIVSSLLQHARERDDLSDMVEPDDDAHVETIDDPALRDILEAGADEMAMLKDAEDRESLKEIVETLRDVLERTSVRRQDSSRN